MTFRVQQACCLLACVFVAHAESHGGHAHEFHPGPECPVAVADAVVEVVDAADDLFHSIENCGEAINHGEIPNSALECTADVFDLISSVAKISMYTVNIFGFCFDKQVKQPACVRTGLRLASAVTGLTSDAAAIRPACVAGERRLQVAATPEITPAVLCVVDVQKAIHAAYDTLAAATILKRKCEHSATECAAGVFEGIAGLSAVAEFTAEAFGDCTTHVSANVGCGEEIASLVKELSEIVTISLGAKDACSAHPEHGLAEIEWTEAQAPIKLKKQMEDLIEAATKNAKYSNRNRIVVAPTSSTTSLTTALLVAAIPLALALGFFGGRRTRAAKASAVAYVAPGIELE